MGRAPARAPSAAASVRQRSGHGGPRFESREDASRREGRCRVRRALLDRAPRVKYAVHRAVDRTAGALVRNGLRLGSRRVTFTEPGAGSGFRQLEGQADVAVRAPRACVDRHPAGFARLCARVSRGTRFAPPGSWSFPAEGSNCRAASFRWTAAFRAKRSRSTASRTAGSWGPAYEVSGRLRSPCRTAAS